MEQSTSAAGGLTEPDQITRLALLERVVQKHPRVIVGRREWVDLRQRAKEDDQTNEWFEDLLDRAEDLLQEPALKYELRDGKRLLFVSRDLLRRVYDFAMCFRLTGDRRFLKGVWREIKAAAAFPDWNPVHFLDTAEMAHGFAIAFDWLHEQWNEEHRATFCDAVTRLAFEPGLQDDAPHTWWRKRDNNWNVVCNGGLGLAAMAFFEEMPDLATEILRRGVAEMPQALRHFAPDGGWPEGPTSYWRYTMQYYVAFVAGAQTTFDTDFGLGDLPGIDRAAMFYVHCSSPSGLFFNFADGGEKASPSPELHFLAKRYGASYAGKWATRYAHPSALDLAWGEPVLGTEPPRDAYFRGVEVVTMRSEWADPEAAYVATQCGENRVGHNQLDLGSFVFDAAGERWVVDMPPDDYNLPGFFGAERFTYYRNRAEGHNVPVLNPSEAGGQDPDASGTVVAKELEVESPSVTMDLTPAYPGAASVRRTLRFERREALVVRDEIRLPEAAEVWWFAHTRAEAEIAADGRGATLSQNGKRLSVSLRSPEGATLKVMPARPLPTSPDPAGQNPDEKGAVRKLAVRLKGVQEAVIEVRFGQ